MKREKRGQKFYAILGGHQDPGETAEQTALREIQEEANLTVTLDRVLCEIDEGYDRVGRGIYFLTTQFSGTPEIVGEEKDRSNPDDSYELAWIAVKDLPTLTVYPTQVKEELIALLL